MKDQLPTNSVYDTTIRLLILLLVIAWSLMILLPFVNILLWSFILAIAMNPLHKKLATKMGGKPKSASLLIIITVFAVIFIPSWFMIDSIVEEVKVLKTSFDSGELSIPLPTEKVKDWPIIGERVYDFWQNTSADFEKAFIKYQDQLIGIARKLASGLMSSVGGVIQTMISFIIATILLVLGGVEETLRKFFIKIAGKRGDEFTDVAIKTVSNVVKGVIGVALIVAILEGVLFLLSGVPYAGIWTLLVFIIGVLQIPVIIVILPIIVYLFAIKSTTAAIIWTVLILVASLSDNVLKPLLLGKGASVPMIVIFIGVIGGFILSGFIGLFTGAIVMSLGYMLLTGWLNSNENIDK